MSDPNELLRRIREIARKAQGGQWMWNSLEDAEDEMEEALTEFLELDRWILSGGFLPAEWNHPSVNRNPAVESDNPWQSPQTALKGEEPF
jgi:hypothetical protein